VSRSQTVVFMDGKVKWFSNEKGYGYIVADDGDDHYFNIRDIHGVDLPKNGDLVSFVSKDGVKGLRAVSVEIVAKTETVLGRSGIDDRVTCSHCGKKMVPRLVYGPFFKGRWAPMESICPFCARVYTEFNNVSRHMEAFNKALLCTIIVFIFLFWVRRIH
jgi:cold shock CspA family protein